MHSIEIDDQVFSDLANRAKGFNVTANDVLRKILNLNQELSSEPTSPVTEPSQPASGKPVRQQLIEFLRSERFQRHGEAVNRYLVILSWLYNAHALKFAEAALGFQRGKRVYFAKSEREILENGEGVTAKQIPQSPFWAMTTLDNKSKRIVLEEILHALRYPPGESNLVLAELPDSGIRRSHDRTRLNSY